MKHLGHMQFCWSARRSGVMRTWRELREFHWHPEVGTFLSSRFVDCVLMTKRTTYSFLQCKVVLRMFSGRSIHWKLLWAMWHGWYVCKTTPRSETVLRFVCMQPWGWLWLATHVNSLKFHWNGVRIIVVGCALEFILSSNGMVFLEC